MNLKKTNSLLESVKKELQVEATPVDPDLARQIGLLMTRGHAKAKHYKPDDIEKALARFGLDTSFEVVGPTGSAQITFNPSKPDELGGSGLNARGWSTKAYRVALREMEDCISVAEQVWNLVK